MQKGELVIENNDVRNNPLPAHDNQRGSTNAITHDPTSTEANDVPSTKVMEDKGKSVEGDKPECSPVVESLLKSSNFRSFFDLLGFDDRARLAVMTTLVQISEGQYVKCSIA